MSLHLEPLGIHVKLISKSELQQIQVIYQLKKMYLPFF